MVSVTPSTSVRVGGNVVGEFHDICCGGSWANFKSGWTRQTEPPEIEGDLMALFPRTEWDMLSHTLIFHGRRTCAARKPACAACPVSGECPSAFHAEEVGRKTARAARPNRISNHRSR